MSGRSSLHSLAACALVLGACGKKAKTPPKPEADPAKAKALALAMVMYPPSPGAVPPCKAPELAGGLPVTNTTLLRIAGRPIESKPEHADWINPPVIDRPAARVLADDKADAKLKRQAAAEFLAAPFIVDYRVDDVDAPIALAVKELKAGFVHARVIRYAMTGKATCASVFYAKNSPEKAAWSIRVSDRAVIDPAVAQAMREDLAAEYVKSIAALNRGDGSAQ